MSYQIETLKNKLEKAEIELQNKSEAIKRRDERIVKLEKFLKDQGIDVPEDLLPKEDEE